MHWPLETDWCKAQDQPLLPPLAGLQQQLLYSNNKNVCFTSGLHLVELISTSQKSTHTYGTWTSQVKPATNATFTHTYIYTRSNSKVMRLVPKKEFILFIHQLKYCHLQSTSLVPAHTFSSGAATVCSIPGMQLEECRLRPV